MFIEVKFSDKLYCINTRAIKRFYKDSYQNEFRIIFEVSDNTQTQYIKSFPTEKERNTEYDKLLKY